MPEATHGIDVASTSVQAVIGDPYPSGDALTAEEALFVTRSSPTRVIVVAGPAESGKTTLVASLYERFHQGPLAGYLFAGSRTLVGFERRCHLSRRASGRETPETERTSRASSDNLLHLSIRPDNGGPRVDLLLTDIYGEAFRQAADSTDEAERLTILKRADHVVILLDGAKLASLAHRQEPFAQADSLIASCLDVNVLGPESQVQVLVTKSDKLQEGPEVKENNSFVASRWEWLRKRYRDRLAVFEKFEVAARPEAPSSLQPAFGIDALLPLWATKPRPCSANTPIDISHNLGPFDGFAQAWSAKRLKP